MAWILDEAIRIPGTRFRIGIDGLIGLIPGVGDTVGALLSTYIVLEAARRGAPLWIVLRMLGNVAIETLMGAVPILGDVFDVVWKANVRNLALLGRTLDRDEQERSPRAVMRLAAAIVVVVCGALVVATVVIAAALYRAFAG